MEEAWEPEADPGHTLFPLRLLGSGGGAAVHLEERVDTLALRPVPPPLRLPLSPC